MQDIKKLKFQFYLGYILTIVVGVLLTLPYLIGITMIRTVLCVFDIVSDTITFMPRAVYEFEQAFKRKIGQIKKD